MMTCNIFINGRLAALQMKKPEGSDVKIYRPKNRSSRPAIVMWDVTPEKVKAFGVHLRRFLWRYRPKSLMFAGNCESTFPGLAELGSNVVLAALQEEGAKQKEEAHSKEVDDSDKDRHREVSKPGDGASLKQ
mmetsp:Transcript_34950/g.56626  ORF Transcript_34950/g.56626 Transcript_34950/m.56626 type:complete len:132 (-) Transcript_34950:14-409(-)